MTPEATPDLPPNIFARHWHRIVLGITALLSIAAFALTQAKDLLFIYDDGVSYLIIARSVFDNIQPGIEQIGSIWLPLSHLAKLPFIWNDFMYHSSLAGSLLSMASYVASCFFIYKIVFFITQNKLSSTVGTFVFGLNPTVLFLQSTSMSEVPFIATFTASVYCFLRYSSSRNVKWLAILAFVNSAMILLRYEGWVIVAAQAGLTIWLQTVSRTMSLRENIGRVFILSLPVALAGAAWLLWNYTITGDALDFVRGEFSASVFTERQKLYGVDSEGKPLLSLLLYGGSALLLLGAPAVVIASIGLFTWLAVRQRRTATTKSAKLTERTKQQIIDYQKISLILLLLSPAIFHVVTMVLGFSIMRVAGIAGDETSLNLRYGIFLLPFVAIGVSVLSKRTAVVALAGMLVMVSYGYMMFSSLPIIDDAREGQIQYREAAHVLRNNVGEDETVLVSMATNAAFMFHSTLDLDRFVHEGAYEQWEQAIEDPTVTDWVVTSRRQDFDTLSELDLASGTTPFRVFYTNDDIALYRNTQ